MNRELLVRASTQDLGLFTGLSPPISAAAFPCAHSGREHRCNEAQLEPWCEQRRPSWLLEGTGGHWCHALHGRTPGELPAGGCRRAQLAQRAQLGTMQAAGGIPVRAGVSPAAGLGARLFRADEEQARSCTQGTCFSDGNSAAGRVVKLLGSC